VIAATNDNKVNEEIGRECQKNNILVSVANNKQLCSFFFPGIVRKGNLVIGITSSGENHAQVKSLVNYLKKHLNVE
jgi:precorrin-2 dehydrogenase/sirohydrochlorin ferrochelatase/precorrin-6A/cobalt-precorrin-6A reductase